jgi:hypothetical protein
MDEVVLALAASSLENCVEAAAPCAEAEDAVPYEEEEAWDDADDESDVEEAAPVVRSTSSAALKAAHGALLQLVARAEEVVSLGLPCLHAP